MNWKNRRIVLWHGVEEVSAGSPQGDVWLLHSKESDRMTLIPGSWQKMRHGQRLID